MRKTVTLHGYCLWCTCSRCVGSAGTTRASSSCVVTETAVSPSGTSKYRNSRRATWCLTVRVVYLCVSVCFDVVSARPALKYLFTL